MTCDRCEDIHEAQKTGVTDKPCKCSCHDNNTNTSNCTCQWNTTWTAPCPIHGWVITSTLCDAFGNCSILNLN